MDLVFTLIIIFIKQSAHVMLPLIRLTNNEWSGLFAHLRKLAFAARIHELDEEMEQTFDPAGWAFIGGYFHKR